jgi:predicted TIM-barrel fold metal-dependent hydrolase
MKKLFNGILDPHSHCFPDFYVETMKNELGFSDCGGAPWPKWSPEGLIQMMDKKGIEKAVLSFTTPGVWFNDNQWSRAFARRCNEYLAEVAGRYPDRVGGFACLPLPDAEGALVEAVYALDELKLDGIGLLSNVNGTYPDEPAYRPVFEALDTRNATVFIHTTDPPTTFTAGWSNIFYGWFIDTSRAVLGMAEAGYLEDYPRVNYILCHAGGVFPAFSDVTRFSNLYYETAKAVQGPVLDRLLAAVDADRVVFGSDYPMANAGKIDYWFTRLEAYFEGNPVALENLLKRNLGQLMESTFNREEV